MHFYYRSEAMAPRRASAGILALCLFCLWSDGPRAAPPDNKSSLNDLSLEVAALQGLRLFQMTPAQMKRLRRVAAETVDDTGARQPAVASQDYRRALVDLRNGLAGGADDDRITELQKKLDSLADDETPELDDGIEITDAARQQTPRLLQELSASQVAAYIASYGDDFPDPVEGVVNALRRVRGLKDEEWKQLRGELSEDVGRLVAGLDFERGGKISDQVVQLLIQARALKDDEFKKQKPELEKSARSLVGQTGPFRVIQNTVELSFAELLSNPRLVAAIDARLKK
jgi:hypothetical protein